MTTLNNNDPIARLPLLDPTGCAAIVRQVDALRPSWLRRDPDLPFYTLGACSYIDGRIDQGYRRSAATLNPLLDQSFDALYDQVLDALRARVGCDFELSPETARPGFHVFEYHPRFEYPLASIHFDRQFEEVPWSHPERMDFNSPLSFTLPLRLPRSGGGLNTWPADWSDWSGDRPPTPELIARTLPMRYVRYDEGVLMLHSGHLLHQIAPATDMQPTDRRITLQGHAVPLDGVCQVYW